MNLKEYLDDIAKKLSGGESSGITDKIKNYLSEEEDSVQEALPEQADIGDTPSYERIKYEEKSDSEIEEEAKKLLGDYENSGKNAVENEIEELKKKYESDKNKLEQSYLKGVEALKSTYDSAKESAGNDLLKRGLARSSVAAGLITGIESDKADKITAAETSYSSDLNAINAEISSLEVKRQKALDDFNISYTAKLTEQINKLKEELSKKVEDAKKYNNSLTEKEYDDYLNGLKTQSEIYSEKLKQAKSENELKAEANAAREQQRQLELYEIFSEYLKSMSKAEAQNELKTNSIYKQYLTDDYYYNLYSNFR